MATKFDRMSPAEYKKQQRAASPRVKFDRTPVPASQQPYSGLGARALHGAERVGGNILTAIPRLAKLGVASGHEMYEHPYEAAVDVGRGAKRYGQESAHNIDALLSHPALANIVDAISPLGRVTSQYQKRTGKPIIRAPKGVSSPVMKDTEFALSLLPLAKASQLGEKAVAEGAKYLPEFLGKRALTKGAGLAAGGAAMSPVTGVSPGESALTNVLLPTAGSLASRAFTKLAPGIGKHGLVTAPEARERQALTSHLGIKMPLGDIAYSGALRRPYKAAETLIGSGAHVPYQQLFTHLVGLKDKLTSRSPISPIDPNKYIFDAYKIPYEKAKDKTHAAYGRLSKLADKHDAPLKLEEFDKTLQDHDKELSRLTKDETGRGVYGKSSRLVNSYMKTRGLRPKTPDTSPVSSLILPIDERLFLERQRALESGAGEKWDFQRAHDTKKTLNDLERTSRVPGRQTYRRYLNSLRDSLESGINSSLEDAGHGDVQAAYHGAKKSRVDQGKFEKLPSGEITPFYKAYSSWHTDVPHLISDYMKPSKDTKDYSQRLDNLLSKLPEADKKVFSDTYLASATPGELSKKLSHLKPRQMSMLLGKDADKGKEFSDILKAYPAAKNATFIPETGFSGTKGTQIASSIAAAAALLHAGNPLLAALTLGGPTAAGQLTQRVLRSPSLSKFYLKGLDGAPKAEGPKPQSLLNMLRASTIMGLQNNA